MIDYGKFRLSLERLRERYERHRTLDDSHPDWIRESVAESTIQRFKTCYDCLWKALRRHLDEELGLADVPNGPKPVFRIAAENGLLPTPTEHWIDYAEKRIGTAHDYDSEKARDCLAVMAGFVAGAAALYETLTGTPRR